MLLVFSGATLCLGATAVSRCHSDRCHWCPGRHCYVSLDALAMGTVFSASVTGWLMFLVPLLSSLPQVAWVPLLPWVPLVSLVPL